MNDEIYQKIAVSIIEQQELIIGPIALDRAKTSEGIRLDWDGAHSVDFVSNPIEAINNLVNTYSDLFGQLSIEVCREASASLISHLQKEQIPSVLR